MNTNLHSFGLKSFMCDGRTHVELGCVKIWESNYLWMVWKNGIENNTTSKHFIWQSWSWGTYITSRLHTNLIQCDLFICLCINAYTFNQFWDCITSKPFFNCINAFHTLYMYILQIDFQHIWEKDDGLWFSFGSHFYLEVVVYAIYLLTQIWTKCT